MRFLIDEQLPPALARWIAARGHEALHVNGIGLAGAKDRAVWDYASRQAAIIVTKDEDFVQLSQRRENFACGSPSSERETLAVRWPWA